MFFRKDLYRAGARTGCICCAARSGSWRVGEVMGGRRVASRFMAPRQATEHAPVGIIIGLGTVVIIGAGLFAALIPSSQSAWRFGIVVLAMGLFAARARDPLAVACVAAFAWLIVNAFLVNRLGELSWHGVADLSRALVLALAGGLGLALGEVRRQVREAGERRRLNVELRALVHDIDEEDRRDA